MGLDPKKPFPIRPRLRDFTYEGPYAYFLTVLTKGRAAYFKEEKVVHNLIDILFEISQSEGFKVITYCFMPDHLHLLLVGQEDKSNLKKFVSSFKQRSGYWFKKKGNEDLWHVSYYDHILRKEESLEAVSIYILENPVRKGLVCDYREYPFSRFVGI
jgi:putative transposase